MVKQKILSRNAYKETLIERTKERKESQDNAVFIEG